MESFNVIRKCIILLKLEQKGVTGAATTVAPALSLGRNVRGDITGPVLLIGTVR
jgi:hypothetical protein